MQEFFTGEMHFRRPLSRAWNSETDPGQSRADPKACDHKGVKSCGWFIDHVARADDCKTEDEGGRSPKTDRAPKCRILAFHAPVSTPQSEMKTITNQK